MKRKLIPIAILIIGLIGVIAYEPNVEQPPVKVAEKHIEESKTVKSQTESYVVTAGKPRVNKCAVKETKTTSKPSQTEVISKLPMPEVVPTIKEKTLEETLMEQGYTIVYDRPQSEMEIYCREDMTLEEWWEMNPPNDGAYDDWDDENNSPDII